jgi:TldD protein
MKIRTKCSTALLAAVILLPVSFSSSQPSAPAGREVPAVSGDDPVLAAMSVELERSKTGLHIDQVAAPYYIEYRVTDTDEFAAEAAMGALLTEVRGRRRALHVVVRIGDYAHDSFSGRGVSQEMPLDDDPGAMRHQIWLATDQAFKAATAAFAAKSAALKQLASQDAVGDFAPSPVARAIEPTASLHFDAAYWRKALEVASAPADSADPYLSVNARARFTAVNRYFANTEGTRTRTGSCSYVLSTRAATMAGDGSALVRTPAIVAGSPEELPSVDSFAARVKSTVDSMEKTRLGPLVTDEYQGPVLFLPDASNDLFDELVGQNVLGRRPRLGNPARAAGAYSGSLRGQVLPEFLTIVDDPTARTFHGQALAGSYQVDDEGVSAVPVTLVDKGKLVGYLMSRAPIRDFARSNGHGRCEANGAAVPFVGNLFVRSSVSYDPGELKRKLLELCRERDLPYGYVVEALAGVETPRVIYRAYVDDGRQEMVRGAELDQVDTRTLRDCVVAAGNDLFVSNRSDGIGTSVIAPSVLIRDVVVKPAQDARNKLPDYPPPEEKNVGSRQ